MEGAIFFVVLPIKLMEATLDIARQLSCLNLVKSHLKMVSICICN
uniref:Uncharacterized protein n=1 Tax=Arundo donax TaxID=35708 RepID=A0A0A9I1R4_ARUDO